MCLTFIPQGQIGIKVYLEFWSPNIFNVCTFVFNIHFINNTMIDQNIFYTMYLDPGSPLCSG